METIAVPCVDAALIRRYDRSGPRYTSYPTALHFDSHFNADAYRSAAARSAGTPLSVYVHLPFCRSPCFYCACTRTITRKDSVAATYLSDLQREIELQAMLFPERRVRRLHLGGGTPTFYRPEQLESLLQSLQAAFGFCDRPERELSIEIDPRGMDQAGVNQLASLGFNRMSFGVQDLDPGVQRAVNRVQDGAQIAGLVAAARGAGVTSVGFDLIYGLPRQTEGTFERTLRHVVDIMPDRLAVYGYAHMPHMFRAQRRLRTEELPSPDGRLALLRMAVELLTGAGYVYVGMDHFARPADPLALAQQQGTLTRDFQGYSVGEDCDLLGLGISAIGRIGDAFAQNCKSLDQYASAVRGGQLAVVRGLTRSADDRVRAAVIQELMCRERLQFADIERRFAIDFAVYFAPELRDLRQLEHDGLIACDSDQLRVLPRGRLLLRNVAMVFDAYLRRAISPAYSRAI